MTLPDAFVRRMRSLLGEEAEAFFAAMDRDPVRALRVLPERANEALYEEFDLSPVPYGENAWYFQAEGVGDGFRHRGGAFYVQDPGAMAPVAALEIRPDARVLDLCAAPGGKAAQAAAFLGPRGILAANEVVFDRCRILLQNLERLGVTNAAVTNADPRDLAEHFGSYFDLVICDAPCSGEGMMRKNSNAVSEWSEENVRFCADRQHAILQSAARLTAPGGTLLYSTCTFAPEENEDQVARFLEEHPDFSLIPASEKVQAVTVEGLGEKTRLCRRFYPHRAPGEGQFFALLKKDPQAPFFPARRGRRPVKEDPGERKIVLDFLKAVLRKTPAGELTREIDGWYLERPLPLPEKGVLSPGTKLGEVRKGRFVPHHRLFCAYPDLFLNRLDLKKEDPRAEAFLRGEEIPVPFDGWGVILCEHTPLGGVKATGGRGKNHLPKGIRKHV